jgi:hypothetical protein
VLRSMMDLAVSGVCTNRYHFGRTILDFNNSRSPVIQSKFN